MGDPFNPDAAYLAKLAGEGLALCYRSAPGYEVRLRRRASLILSGEPFGDLNYAIVDAGPESENDLEEFLSVAGVRDLPLLVLFTARAQERLDPIARRRGLRMAGHFTLMTFTPESSLPVSTRYQVECVEEAEGLAACNDLLARSVGVPRRHLDRAFGPGMLEGPGIDVFLARHNEEPRSTLQTARAGKAVGIWAMATPPEHQRKGAGRCLLDHVINHHLSRGARLFFIGCTEAGKRLYSTFGFKTIELWTVWAAGEAENPSKASA